MVAIASRLSWGARYQDGDRSVPALADEVFLHHSVTTHLPATASVAQEQAQMRAIESIGQSRFGTGISYNVVIFPSGRAYQGVSWNRRGTHTGGRNSTSRSICFAGNYEAARPTDAQLDTAAAILARGRGLWWTKTAPLRSHRDVAATACPGRYVHAARADILARAAQLVSRPVSPGAPSIPTPSAPALPDAPPFAAPRKQVPAMFITVKGRNAWRLITGDRIVGISQDAADAMRAAGVPYAALPIPDIETLERVLVAENL